MKSISFIIFCTSIIFINIKNAALAQSCSGIVSTGQNLVTNGDFSQGYTGWSHDPAYIEYTPCSNCYSVPGRIYAGSSQQSFNQAFPNNPDHSSSSDNNFLMVDGICTAGIDLWRQTNIPIQPNTNYYFSVWITSLKTSTTPGTLNFNINGTDLVTNITAPAAGGTWIKFPGAVWNSGPNPPATITISIQNTQTNGCDNAVDFGIDDITFTPGCDFGGVGPMPDLGPDFSICGKTLPFNINPNFNAANETNPKNHYKWFKDGVEQTGFTSYDFSVNAPGTYAVCVDSANNCPKTDILVISNTFAIELGPDQKLCNPVTTLLDAGYTGQGVTYEWSKNSNLISGQTGSTLLVTSEGNYSVKVTDQSCGVKTSSIGITSDAAKPVDGTFCPVSSGGTGTANLSVVGPGKYKWYSAATGNTVVLATGPTYTTPVLTGSGPYIYYVEDTSTYAGTVGPPTTNTFTNLTNVGPDDGNNGKHKSAIYFNAVTAFKLDTITVVPFIYNCPWKVIISIKDNAGTHLPGSPVTRIFNSPGCVNAGGVSSPIKVPINISIPQGTGYQIQLDAGSDKMALYLNETANGAEPNPQRYVFPTTYQVNGNDVLTVTGNDPNSFNLYYSPDAIPAFFGWKITSGIPCQRVPVTATLLCPLCTNAIEPTAAKSDVTKFCKGSTSNIILSVTGGSGDSLAWYTGSCGGSLIDRIKTGTLSIAAPSVTTTYYARWESVGCNSTCASVIVTPVDPPNTSAAGMNQNICNANSVTLTGNASTVPGAIGFWKVMSGTGTMAVADTTNPNATVTGLIAGDLILRWTMRNSPCADSASEVTIHKDTLSVPVLSLTGASYDTCSFTSGVTYSTTVDHTLSGSTYLWAGNSTLSITGSSNNYASVDIGASGGTLTVTETKGACSLAASKLITITPVVSGANAGIDQSVCVDHTTLNAAMPIIGKGEWSVSSGTGNFADHFDPHSIVTELSNGPNILFWTVRGCGGPFTDDVIINVGVSNMVLSPSMVPTDTLCVGITRNLSVTVAGGSGHYYYLWASSDSSFKAVTNKTSVSVSPLTNTTTYYVYAMDSIHFGCFSNVDSMVIHAITRQDLSINNLLTPNADNKNDKLIIRDFVTLQKILPGSHLEVYNQWGSKVYHSNNYDNSWGAQDLADGVYYYHLKTGCGTEVYKGWVQIIR